MSVVWVGLILPLFSVVGKAGSGCPGQALSSGLADRLASALVLVVRGDVTDAGVQPGSVVLQGPDPGSWTR